LILALVGSTIGAVICFIIPALIFIKLSDKNTIEYLFSYLLVFFGVVILVFCTFSALHNISSARDVEIEEKIKEIKQKTTVAVALPPKVETAEKIQLPPVVVTTEFKSRIKNMSKLKESIKIDLDKLKKQDELLQRLEKQQQEHSKILKEQREIINELKSHDQAFHDGNGGNLTKGIAGNGSISLSKVTSSLPSVKSLPKKSPDLVGVIAKPNLSNDSVQVSNDHHEPPPLNVLPVGKSEPKQQMVADVKPASQSPLKSIVQLNKSPGNNSNIIDLNKPVASNSNANAVHKPEKMVNLQPKEEPGLRNVNQTKSEKVIPVASPVQKKAESHDGEI